MDSFTIELFPNVSGDLIPNNTLSFFTNFLPEQVDLEGQWKVIISEPSYPSINQNITGGQIQVFWRENFKIYDNLQSRAWSIHFHHRHCGSHEHAHSGEKQPQRKLHNSQSFSRNAKVVVLLANDTSGFAFCSTDLGHIFGNNVGNEFGVLMIGKGPHGPQFAYTVRIHSLMIYSDLVECNNVGDTNAPLLRCFPFISKLKGRDIITTGQYLSLLM